MNPASAGLPSPIGATVRDGGVNFSLYSRTATGVELHLFDREDSAKPSRTVVLDSVRNRTYHYWHTFVPGVQAGQLYGYRVHGPADPAKGLRFDPAKLLLDPYARGVAVPAGYSSEPARRPGDNAAAGSRWRRWIDTSLPSPDDITEWRAATPVAGTTYRAGPRSVVMFFTEAG